MPPAVSSAQHVLAPSPFSPSAMHIDGSSEEDESSQDELQSPKQATPKQNNKKRTREQRSPQKLSNLLVGDAVISSQKSRWEHFIAQGILAFQNALEAVQGQNAEVEAATRELLCQTQAVQQGKTELALAATKELAKEI